MPILFACPSCQQPLEIDDQWAGQSVACPYCKRVVAAPTSSTWSPGQQVPVAAPARSAFEPPPPPPGAMPAAATPRPISATWAISMTACSMGFLLVGFFAWYMAMSNEATQRFGKQPTTQQIRELQQEMLKKGSVPVHPVTPIAMIIGTLCGLAGVVLGIRAATGTHRRGAGIAAATVSLLCVVCQGLTTISLLSAAILRHQQG